MFGADHPVLLEVRRRFPSSREGAGTRCREDAARARGRTRRFAGQCNAMGERDDREGEPSCA